MVIFQNYTFPFFVMFIIENFKYKQKTNVQSTHFNSMYSIPISINLYLPLTIILKQIPDNIFVFLNHLI